MLAHAEVGGSVFSVHSSATVLGQSLFIGRVTEEDSGNASQMSNKDFG